MPDDEIPAGLTDEERDALHDLRARSHKYAIDTAEAFARTIAAERAARDALRAEVERLHVLRSVVNEDGEAANKRAERAEAEVERLRTQLREADDVRCRSNAEARARAIQWRRRAEKAEADFEALRKVAQEMRHSGGVTNHLERCVDGCTCELSQAVAAYDALERTRGGGR